MLDKIKQLNKNNTWTLVPKPNNLNNKDIIKGRWVLNKKFINNNKEPIYKARFIIKGF